MRLLPFQREFIERIYADELTRAPGCADVPRGNGKTGSQAVLILCHLLGPEAEPRGEVYAAAIDCLQAGILFNEVVAIIEATPDFADRVNVQRFQKIDELMATARESIFEALSSDARRGHGLAPSLFVYDEFAQAKSGELLDNLITGRASGSGRWGSSSRRKPPTICTPSAC